MFGSYLQVRGQVRSVEEGGSDVEIDGAPAGHGRKIVMGVLALGAVVALGATAGSSTTTATQIEADVDASADDARFLQSDDLLQTIATHAVRFQQEMGGEVAEGDHDELKAHARRSIAEMAQKVSTEDVDAGRLLKDIQLNDEQWYQSKQILEALHDKKVQDIGNFVQNSVRNSGSVAEAAEKVSEREGEFRELRDHFVPSTLHNVAESPAGENHWSMAMKHGELDVSGSALGWSGSLSFGGEETARRLAENVTDDRRLMTKQQMIYLIVTAVVVSVLGIVLTILTAALGAQAATLLFIIGAGIDGLLCTGSVGLTFLPGFKNFNTWIPCVILSSFTGLEAIWTFRKPRCSHTCPNGGKIINNRCYFMVAGSMDFTTAQTTCSSRSAQLASLRDAKDWTKVQLVLASNSAWIGATRTCPAIKTKYAASPPTPQNPASCTTPWSWTDGTTWYTPSALTQPNTFTTAVQGTANGNVGKPSGYQNLYVKTGTTIEGAFTTATNNALCELWMCR
jgi:hypothetical protein